MTCPSDEVPGCPGVALPAIQRIVKPPASFVTGIICGWSICGDTPAPGGTSGCSGCSVACASTGTADVGDSAAKAAGSTVASTVTSAVASTVTSVVTSSVAGNTSGTRSTRETPEHAITSPLLHPIGIPDPVE